MLRHLRNRHAEGFGKIQKGNNQSYCDRFGAVQRQQAANQRDQDILQISQLHDKRHQHIAIFVRIGRIAAKSLVALPESLFGMLFMAENLNDLLPVDHLFNISGDISEACLLMDKVTGTAAADHLGAINHQSRKSQHNQSKRNAACQHGRQNDNNRNHCQNQLRQCLTDKLPERVRIVCIIAHDVAVRMGIKITDRQLLHMCKHFIPDAFQGSLRHLDHQLVIQQRAEYAAQINHPDCQDRTQQTRKVRAARSKQGCDIAVHQCLQEQRACHSCTRTDENAEQHGGEGGLVPADDIGKQPLCRFCSIRLRLHHGRYLLSSVKYRYHDKSRWTLKAVHASRNRKYVRHPIPESHLRPEPTKCAAR